MPRAEVLVMSGAKAARYYLDVDSSKEAEKIALAEAKSRGLRQPYVLQTIFPLKGDYALDEHPEFTRTRVLRDGR